MSRQEVKSELPPLHVRTRGDCAKLAGALHSLTILQITQNYIRGSKACHNQSHLPASAPLNWSIDAIIRILSYHCERDAARLDELDASLDPRLVLEHPALPHGFKRYLGDLHRA